MRSIGFFCSTLVPPVELSRLTHQTQSVTLGKPGFQIGRTRLLKRAYKFNKTTGRVSQKSLSILMYPNVAIRIPPSRDIEHAYIYETRW